MVTIAGDAEGILRDGAENRWVKAEIDVNRFQLQREFALGGEAFYVKGAVPVIKVVGVALTIARQ